MVSDSGRRRIYWDSCVWLYYINEHPDQVEILELLLEDSANSLGDREIFTSVIAQTEVAYAAIEQTRNLLDSSVEARIDSLWADRRAVRLVEFYPRLALDARELIRGGLEQRWNLKPLDAIHLATAKRWNVDEFHTYDERLLRYTNVLGFPILRPYVTGQRGFFTDPNS